MSRGESSKINDKRQENDDEQLNRKGLSYYSYFIGVKSEWLFGPREQERSVNQGSEERKSLSHLDRRIFPSMSGQRPRRDGQEQINARETLLKRSKKSQVGMIATVGRDS